MACLLSLLVLPASADWVEPTNEGNMEVVVPDGFQVIGTSWLHTRVPNTSVDVQYQKAFVFGPRGWFDEVRSQAEFEYYIRGAKLVAPPECREGEVDVCWGRITGKLDKVKGSWLVIVGQIPNGGAGVSLLVAGTPEDLAAHADAVEAMKTGFRAKVEVPPPAPVAEVDPLPEEYYEDDYYADDYLYEDEAPDFPPFPPFAATAKYPGECRSRSEGVSFYVPFAYLRTYTWEGDRRVALDLDAGTWQERVTYAYDDAGRLVTERSEQTGFPPRTVRTTWDAQGRKVRAETSAEGEAPSSTTFAYDAAGHLTSETGVAGEYTGVTRYAYDAAGHLVKEDRGEGDVVEHTYDAAGRRARSVSPGGTTDYVWDAEGRPLIETYTPVELSYSSPVTTKRWTYDAFGNLLSLVIEAWDGAERSIQQSTEFDYACWAATPPSP